MASQREILMGLAEQANTTMDDLQDIGSSTETRARVAALREAREVLDRFLGDGEEHKGAA